MDLRTHKRLLVSSTLFIGLLAGCSVGPGYSVYDTVCAKCSESNGDSASSTDGSDRASQSLPSREEVFTQVNLKASIQGGSYDGLMAVDFDVKQESLILHLPLAVNPFIIGVSGEVPDLPGVTFATTEGKDGSKFLSLRVPLKYVIKGVKNLNPARLPNGDPLPNIPAGELPGLGLQLMKDNNVTLNIYIGVDVVALYVESPFDPYIKMTFPIKNQAGSKIVGYFSTIPEKDAHSGGFFLSHALPQETAEYLDKHVIW
jgi:hypothetical protein